MIIGVTGGIGCGKSTVLNILKEKYDAAIIMADDVAKELMLPGNASYEGIVGYFGENILKSGKGSEIDRALLSDIVFKDDEKLKILNSLTHPNVEIEIRKRIKDFLEAGITYIVIEAALFIEAGYKDFTDELWVIVTDYETRLKRLYESRGLTKEKADSIIDNQLSDSEMVKYADFVIDNSGSIENTERQISERLSNYM